VTVAAVLVITVGFMPVRFEQFATLCGQDMPTTALAQLCTGYRITISLVIFGSSLAIGGFVMTRRSDDWMVLLASAMAISTAALFAFMSAIVPVPPEWYAPTLFIRVFSPFLIFIFLYVFPDGRILPRLAILPMVASLAITLSWVAFPASPFNIYNLATWPFSLLVTAVCLVVGVGAQYYRYVRFSTPPQRQQTKWIIIGVLAIVPAFAIAYLTYGLFPDVKNPGAHRLFYTLLAEPFFQLTFLFTLVCTAIAVLRYRLWDVDLIIRRTVLYALVAATLALVYFVCVIGLQQIFANVSGQRSEVITVISTLAIAALFVPLRNRFQGTIDKRFNRNKYNAQQVLSSFAETVRDETDLEKLSERLVEVVNETMQPHSVSVWLKKDERGNLRK
jgi:hypothetical protein